MPQTQEIEIFSLAKWVEDYNALLCEKGVLLKPLHSNNWKVKPTVSSNGSQQ